MSNVKIFEQIIDSKAGIGKGKIAILVAEPEEDKPKQVMDAAVEKYVGENAYNEFIEIYLDNPWVRVVVKDINELNYTTFLNQKL